MSERAQAASVDQLAALQAEVRDLRGEVERLKRRPFRLLNFTAQEGAGGTLDLVSTRTGFRTTIARHS